MLKTALLVLAASALSATAAVVYVGRTVHSSPFQMDIPFGSAIRTTVDPANVWSWHHEFPSSSQNQIADVLVDVDGNNVMDTEHAWLRVMVTDMELVSSDYQPALAWILDGTGKRYAIGTGNLSATGPAFHVSLTSPITLPVGSPLRVELQGGTAGDVEVHLVGRVVNL